MPSGGRRPGAGRPAGKPNRESRERIERATGLTWEQIAERRRQWLASMGFVCGARRGNGHLRAIRSPEPSEQPLAAFQSL
jgi:hypothetical protein